MGIFGDKKRGRPSNKEVSVKGNEIKDLAKNLADESIAVITDIKVEELPKIKIRKLDEKASDPVRKSFGFKVFSGEEKVILTSKSNAVVDTKLEVEVPGGYYLRVAPSSSFGFSSDIVAFSGILEEGKHNLKIKFYNNSNRVKEFRLGEALADIEILKVNYFDLEIGE